MRPEFLYTVVDAALALVMILHAAKFVIVEIADLWIKIRATVDGAGSAGTIAV